MPPIQTHQGTKHDFLFGLDQASIRLVLERNADQMASVAHYIHLCFPATCPMSHLAPAPDCVLQFD